MKIKLFEQFNDDLNIGDTVRVIGGVSPGDAPFFDKIGEVISDEIDDSGYFTVHFEENIKGTTHKALGLDPSGKSRYFKRWCLLKTNSEAEKERIRRRDAHLLDDIYGEDSW